MRTKKNSKAVKIKKRIKRDSWILLLLLLLFLLGLFRYLFIINNHPLKKSSKEKTIKSRRIEIIFQNLEKELKINNKQKQILLSDMIDQKDNKNLDDIAVIDYYRGKVKVKPSDSNRWMTPKIKSMLKEGVIIHTYPNSRTFIKLKHGGKIKVRHESIFSINSIKKGKKTILKINIIKGDIYTKLKTKKNVEIETPDAKAIIKGREFTAIVKDNIKSMFGIYYGNLIVSINNKKTALKQGYGTVVYKGKRPLTPFKLAKQPHLYEL